jgi:beta-galactosidase
MPSVTYNGQSFAIDGRRFWILGATLDYARVPTESWEARLADIRQAGFNTVAASCPWSVHEPRPDRFNFDGEADLAKFVRLCGQQSMRVILRIGPFIGDGYDGGGLPNWLGEIPGMRSREENEPFFERVVNYFRRLLAEIEPLQATRGGRSGGPLLMLQVEHAWLCSNPQQANGYLREITRLIRENGVNIPLINANDLWQDIPGTIDTWRGRDDLLAHLRQLRAVQPDAPRLLSELDIAQPRAWGDRVDGRHDPAPTLDARQLLSRLAQCLAAGAQPVVSPFVGGMNFGFLGGRLSGSPDRFVMTSAADGAVIDEAGRRSDRYAAVKRIVTFASHFGHVFAELSPDYHAIVPMIPSPADDASGPLRGGRSKSRTGADAAPSIAAVPLSGSQGSIVFLFSGGQRASTTLLLGDGVAMPVEIGDSGVAWVALNVDLGGAGRLDYTNLCPFGLVKPRNGEKSGAPILVLFGPAKTEAFLSIGGSPLSTTVPGGEKPFVVEHKGITVVIGNEEQIDQTYLSGEAVYVGAQGLTLAGAPIASGGGDGGGGGKAPWRVTEGAVLKRASDIVVHAAPALDSRAARIPLKEWHGASGLPYTTGDSPRFATLDGPCSLPSCGAPTGYGWYRVRLKSATGRKRLCHLPEAGHRVHLYLNGDSVALIGCGPGAAAPPMELNLPKGDLTLVALVDNLGRFSAGNDLGERTGLFGHLLELKSLRVKSKRVTARPVDPFTLRGYIEYRAKGQLSSSEQLQWQFTHTRKSNIVIDVQGVAQSGTFVLNDVPIAYYAGATGAASGSFIIGQTTHDAFKRGKNEVRFAPDAHQDSDGALARGQGITLYEVAEQITEGASWAFARWEPPDDRSFAPMTKTGAKRLRNAPAWWRCRVALPKKLREQYAGSWLEFDTAGLSKGQVFINGRNLGRYFTSTLTGKNVGPQTTLPIPASWLHEDRENEILVFDEHGFDPYKARLRVVEG